MSGFRLGLFMKMTKLIPLTLGFIAAGLTIMLILINSPSLLYTSPMSMESWFVLAAMFLSIGNLLRGAAANYSTLGSQHTTATGPTMLLPFLSPLQPRALSA